MLCSHQTEDFKEIKVFHCPWWICYTFQSFAIWKHFFIFSQKSSSVSNEKIALQFHRVVCSSIITLMTISNTHLLVCWMENRFHESESESEEKVFFILCLMSHVWKIISQFSLFLFTKTFVYKTLGTTESSHEYLHCRGLIVRN